MDIPLLLALVFFISVSVFVSLFVFKLFKTKVPFIPTPDVVCDRMILLAEIETGLNVIDLGSGNGKLLFKVLEKGAICKGYELVRPLIWWSNIRRYFSQDRSRITFFCQDFFTVDHSASDVVFCYLWPSIMDRFLKEIYPTLKPGTRIISHAFRIHDLKELKMEEVSGTKVWVYVK